MLGPLGTSLAAPLAAVTVTVSAPGYVQEPPGPPSPKDRHGHVLLSASQAALPAADRVTVQQSADVVSPASAAAPEAGRVRIRTGSRATASTGVETARARGPPA